MPEISEGYFRINDNIEPVYNGIYTYLENKGYNSFRQNDNWSKDIFEKELQKIYEDYFLYPGIELYERRKDLIVPKWICESDKIMFGAFKNAGENKESGYLLKSNNEDLIKELEKIIINN